MFDYDGRLFSARGDHQAQAPVAHYRQDGDLVWGDFAGGPVRRGTLAGRCAADGTLLFAYCMVLDDGAVVSGRCRSTPQLLDDGRIRLSEEWERYAPDAETGFSYLDELPPAAGRTATSPGSRAATSPGSRAARG
jgi:hypothetical protein